jgi:hypothetical protein
MQVPDEALDKVGELCSVLLQAKRAARRVRLPRAFVCRIRERLAIVRR